LTFFERSAQKQFLKSTVTMGTSTVKIDELFIIINKIKKFQFSLRPL
jgi:hypothetical protein